jgi:tetratricopeptide (TPR) repeat protein
MKHPETIHEAEIKIYSAIRRCQNHDEFKLPLLLSLVFAVFLSCATTGSGETAPAPYQVTQTVQQDNESVFEGDGLSLEEAITQSAGELAEELPDGIRVAVIAFTSEHKNLSNYIMDELAGALADGSLEVADRQNLEYVYKELGFQMSGDVSDETAVSIGKFLGAQYVATGQLVKAGGRYRYRLSGINVETAAQESSSRLNVRDDRAFQRLLADVRQAPTTTASASYGGSNAQPKTAGAFLDRGILFATRGDFDLAIADFTEAVKLDDNLASAYFQRGKAYFARQSRLYTAITEDFDYDYLISRRKKTADDDLAIKDFSRAIQLQPDNPVVYFWRSQVYIDICEDDKAFADSNQAIRLDPNYAMAYRNRGNVYSYKGDKDRAIADYTQAIQIEPNRDIAYNNRAITYSDKGEYDKALADYNQAIRLEPSNAHTYSNRGTVYAKKGDYDRAIADYNQAIKLDPNYALAYINRGIAYLNKGDNDRAIADYNQAVKLDPNYALAYINRGIAYYNKGDYDRAITDYTEAIRLNPNDAVTYIRRGIAHYDKEESESAIPDHAKAIADYNQAVRIDSGSDWAYYERGLAYHWSNCDSYDLNKAIADYTQAIKLAPNHANAYNGRGVAYRDKGDYNRACADWEKALQIDPNHQRARDNLEALRKEGH